MLTSARRSRPSMAHLSVSGSLEICFICFSAVFVLAEAVSSMVSALFHRKLQFLFVFSPCIVS